MMKVAIITVAGISKRFNDGVVEENKKVLKAIYSEGNSSQTLLFHLIDKCNYADKIILVGGYKFETLNNFIQTEINNEIRDKITVVYNKYYKELSSGYSLYLGLKEAFQYDLNEVLFVEGDIDIDIASFKAVVEAESSVLTYNREPICSEKSVILYRNKLGQYQYVFNISHGLIKIDDFFSEIYNSGQLWKFKQMNELKEASDVFFKTNRGETNLKIIQEYINRVSQDELSIIQLQRWINCNTKNDYKIVKEKWEEES